MADFKVGDLVKKVRGTKHVGHQGWVTLVTIAGSDSNPNLKLQGLQVTGLPKEFLSENGVLCHYYNAALFEKVVLTGEDRCVTDKAPKEEMA